MWTGRQLSALILNGATEITERPSVPVPTRGVGIATCRSLASRGALVKRPVW